MSHIFTVLKKLFKFQLKNAYNCPCFTIRNEYVEFIHEFEYFYLSIIYKTLFNINNKKQLFEFFFYIYI